MLTRRWGRSGIFGSVVFLALVASTVPADAQFPSTPYLRWRYFYDQRAYPYGFIPAGAMQQARQSYLQQWPASPQGLAPQISGSVWSSIGPTQVSTFGTLAPVGRLNTIAIHPTDSNTIYIGGAQGGVWKTTNGGTSWTPRTDDQCSLAMGSIAIDPVTPNIVYAGTGEENFSVDSYYGCGVLRSSDAGGTWTKVGAAVFDTATGGATIARIIIDPATAGSTSTTTLLAATSFGVYRSTNSGTSWTRTLSGTATDIVFDPSNSATVYAALGNSLRSVANGIYKSTDQGATWTKLAGFNPGNVGRINLGIAKSAPDTVYASVQNSGTFALLGIFKTTDGGTTWPKLSATNAACGAQCWYDMVVAVDPTDANTVYFGGVQLYKSTDGGASFATITTKIHVDQHAFAFDPQNPNVVYAGNDGGIYKSTNGGSSWTTLNSNMAITQFTQGISLHPTNPAIVMGGTQDNGTLRTTGSLTWTDVFCPATGTITICADGGYTAVDFNTPTIAYGTTQWTPGSSFSGPRRSDNVGTLSFVRKVNGININDNAQFYPPLVMSPSDPTRLYFGTCLVYRTTDEAETWTAVSPACGTWLGTLTAIAEAPSSSQVIYAATSAGEVHVTANGGVNWSLVTAGLPLRFPTALAVHLTLPGTAFVTFSGFGSGHVFKTTTTGSSWTNISGNLPDLPVNAILLDPGDPVNTIYIGTDLGVFKTSDGGTTWLPFNTGLPNVAVFDLAFRAGGVLTAATHGRSMFELNTSGQGLAVSLSATPSSGTGPVGTALTATPSGLAAGTLNYTFWWNCSDPGTDVTTVMATCGTIPTPPAGLCESNVNGVRCVSVSDTSRTLNHIYSSASPGTFTAKVIVEQGTATPAEQRTTITLTGSTGVSLAVSLNQSTFSTGSLLTGTLTKGGSLLAGDLHVRLLSFSGQEFVVGSVAGVTIPNGTFTLLSGNLSSLQPGIYGLFVVLVKAGSDPTDPGNWLSNRASATFTFSGP